MKKPRKVSEDFNIYEQSGELNQYKGFTVAEINGIKSVSFTNGVTIYAGKSVA